MVETALNRIKDLIDKAKRIAVVPHCRPDGDAVGALIALSLLLQRLGKTVEVLSPSEPSERYAFLSGFDLIEVTGSCSKEVELVIFVDCTDKDRCLPWQLPESFTGSVINIDHHADNSFFGDVDLVLPQASSTGEVLVPLWEVFGQTLTPAEASALYVSLLTDTGSFHFSNTSPATLSSAASLVAAGADPHELTYRLFELTNYDKTKLLGLVLATLECTPSREIAWVKVTAEMFEQTNTTAAVVEDFVNYVSRIQEVKIALLFREEEPQSTKISIRTVEGIEANKIARLFDGGGHKVAAGCRLKTPLEQSITRVLAACEEELTAVGRDN